MSEQGSSERTSFEQNCERMHAGAGFIAALDQSGGSTPKALRLYGIPDDQYQGESQMFDLVHQMRERIMTSPAFTGDHIVAAILFEQTMHREVGGVPTADYLLSKNILPILKVDKGLADAESGVQLMKPMPDLAATLQHAVDKHIFGTKMRSVIKEDSAAGIQAIVDQQFDVAGQIAAAGLVPILEPEVDIHAEAKSDIEDTLLEAIQTRLESWPDDRPLMFKLTIPTQPDLYETLVADAKVLRIVALSGGYSRDEACRLLAENHGVIASFSRALTEGLTAQQSDEEFNAALAASIAQIATASAT